MKVKIEDRANMCVNRYGFSLFFNMPRICTFLFLVIVLSALHGCSGTSKQAKSSHENVSEKNFAIELPNIGETVTTESALKLCVHYGLNHLARRIEDNPDLYKEWEFDGCSMTPDKILSELIKVPTLTEICLKHDLGYAYGDPGNQKERKTVDIRFQNELLSAGASEFAAKVMFDAVRLGGKEEHCLPFSWSFARVEPCKRGYGLKIEK
jgi:hypothetical protein